MSAYILNQDPDHQTQLRIGQLDMLADQLGLPKYSAVAKAEPKREASDEEVCQWGERHDIRLSGCDLRCAFDDAATAHMTAAHPPRSQVDAEPKLDMPAKVGASRFGVGVSWATVIGAAQRLYEYEVTPEKEAERIAQANQKLNDFRSGIVQVISAARDSERRQHDADSAELRRLCAERDEARRQRDAALAIRRELGKLPRYSFQRGVRMNVVRTESRNGIWVAFDSVDQLFAPVTVDTAEAHVRRKEGEA